MRIRIKIDTVLVNAALLVSLVFALFPIYIAVINSFKTNGEMARAILAIPTKIHFLNYTNAFERLNFFRSTLNTLALTVLSVAGMLIASALAGYKIARNRGMLGKVFYILFISSMLIPFHSIMIPLTRITAVLGVKGSILGTVAVYIGLGINMAIFLYTGFVRAIPLDLEEAAVIDGAGSVGTFYHVVVPLLKPITATIAILQSLWIWNDFLLPLLMITNSDNYTLILSANKFFGKYTADWTSLMAGMLMTSIPLVLFFLAFQRHIIKGITAGAVKG